MAVTGLSEFMFGYGFLYEQTTGNWGGLRAAPMLPSLAAEADQGWDAHLPTVGTDFYYQFKLSDYLSRRNSKFYGNPYKTPYFRISMHRRHRNRQHNLLVAHSLRNPDTFYVAPEIKTLRAFNAAFLTGQVAASSRMIPLNRCWPYGDGEQHYITFQSGKRSWRQHSDPIDNDESYFGPELEKLYRNSEQRWRPINRAFAGSILEGIVASLQFDDRVNEPTLLNREEGGFGTDLRDIDSLIDWAMASSNVHTILVRAAQIAAIGLGVSLVLVGVDG